MRPHPKLVALTVLALGCITLVVPLFTTPEPVFPTWLSFLPYAMLAIDLFIARSRAEHRGIVTVSVTTLLTGYFYLDTIYFNRVFSWQVLGPVMHFLPLFQLAFGIPALVILTLRRWRLRDETHVV